MNGTTCIDWAGRAGRVSAAVFVGALLAAFAGHARASESARDFAYRVQPILSDKCFNCHGPDEANRPSDLRLDTEEGITEAFAGGDLASSEAWRRILSDDPDEVMPPTEVHKPFTDTERQTLRDWAEAGAHWSPHWAFTPPQKVAFPHGADAHPIDAFVNHRLEEVGLPASPRASKEKLLRRLTFDLHGLPPTPAEIDAFLDDEAPGAWERVINRLLASPRFGERMAVAWLDGARYADTNGYQNDFARTMWPWRDWVIDAYNRNRPFDRFTIEQLAGDLLPEPTREQRLATAFNRNNRTVTEAGSIPEEWLVENVVDRVETTSSVFLGLTMGCARCHDHKFDPVTQEEFYEFFAFFNSIDEQGVYTETHGNVGPAVQCVSASQQVELLRLAERVAYEEQRLASIEERVVEDAIAWRVNTAPPRPLAAAAAVRLDGEPCYAVADGERVVEPSTESQPPKIKNSFLGPIAAFSGDQRLEYHGLLDPERDRPMTITAWVRREGGGAVLSKMHDAEAFRGVDWLFDEQGRLMLHLISHWPDDALKVTTKSPLPAGRWIHVSVSYDGTAKPEGLAVHFGLEKQEFDVNNNSLTGSLHTDQPLRIGRRADGSDFQGSVGRVRCFERVLSLDELHAQVTRDLQTAPAPNDGEPPAPEWLAQYVGLASDRNSQDYAEVSERLDTTRREEVAFRESLPTCMVMKELPEPRPTFVLDRGEYDKPDKDRPVSPNLPDFLGDLSIGRADRMALAEWIVSRDNPLTARVVVNRMWGRLFGTGIVKSEENFGVQCEPPTHPNLLDWLAVELMESGWDQQHLIRLIVTSETYQRTSSASPEDYAADPGNRMLARGPRRRLPAEFVRDNALAVSGLLASRVGGPPAFPYQPAGLWEELAGGAGQGPYEQSEGDDLYRRSLYTYRKRTVPHPTMSTFDAPSFEICLVKRSTTNTPLQALALLNDITYVEAARVFGERMLREGGEDDANRLAYGFRLATSRRPSDAELSRLAEALDRRRTRYASDPEAAKQFLLTGEAPVDPSFDPSELAAYGSLGALLLNLDETISID